MRRRAWRRTCRPNLGPSTSSACAASYPRRLRLAALPAAGQLPPRQLGLCGPAGPLPSPGGGTAVGQPADCCVSKLGPLPVHRAREVRVPCWQPGARRGAQASAERVSARGGAAPRPTLCCYTTVFTHRSTRRPASAPHPSHVTSPTQPRLPAHPSPPPRTPPMLHSRLTTLNASTVSAAERWDSEVNYLRQVGASAPPPALP